MATMRSALECAYCDTRNTCFLRNVARTGAAAGDRTTHSVRKREVLHREGDAAQSVAVVCTGRVKVYRLAADGKTLITKMAQVGDPVGLADAFAGRTHTDYAEATEHAVIARIDRATLMQLIARDPRAAEATLSFLGREAQQSADQALHVAYASAAERVIDTLRALFERDDRCQADGLQIKRQDLADMTGLTIETTVRTLKALERDGALRLDGTRIHIDRDVHYAFAA